ncbi:hypothetical protein Moror_6066 [Moniliophthora roreri MCA 2997]|uniref:Uncharacterized protein n=1 Tax=Moniliophthora roreri (strain MCA 2997) TaxID=1381753 RepID=V2WRF3_MONRO|nr:hypothetical protein Moror_6066 [Moniliophthora roreri MCA 2997]
MTTTASMDGARSHPGTVGSGGTRNQSPVDEPLDLIYPPSKDVVDHTSQHSSPESVVSRASDRAELFPNVSPPITPPPMSHSPITPLNHASRFNPSNAYRRMNATNELESTSLTQSTSAVPPTPNLTQPQGVEAWMVEVYDLLNALCADWANTAPSTALTTVVQSVELLRLDISLETAVTNEGLLELRDATIPAVLHLLTTIHEMISIGITTSRETESNEQPGATGAPAITVDVGEEEGPRTFFFSPMDRFAVGEWLVGGRPIANEDVYA